MSLARVRSLLSAAVPAIHLPGQCRLCTSGRGSAWEGEAFWPHLHTETAAEALDGHSRREGEFIILILVQDGHYNRGNVVGVDNG